MPAAVATGDTITVEEIREKDPRFYAWYISQPVVDLKIDAQGSRAAGPDHPGRVLRLRVSRVCARLHRSEPSDRVGAGAGPADPSQLSVELRLQSAGDPAGPRARVPGGRGLRVRRRAGEVPGVLPDAVPEPERPRYAEPGRLRRAARARPGRVRALPDLAGGGGEGRRRTSRPGAAAGVESTPTFFINGRRVPGSLRPEHFQYALAIERARRDTAAGSPGATP